MRMSYLRSFLVLVLVVFAVLSTGGTEGSCLPEPLDLVCDSDDDCPSGQVCNLFSRCVAAFVTVDTDRDWYAAGEAVGFTVDPRGLPLEVGAMGGQPPWAIERWSERDDRWLALRVGTLFGCRMTGCVDGLPVQLCVDPGPPWCFEHDAPFTDSWDGTHWVATEEPCGGRTITVDRRVPAGPGSYRVVFRYGDDPTPGATSPTGSCAPQDRAVNDVFGIR